jgi:hypothetical protein
MAKVPQTKTSYFPLGGGLDLTTPALSVKPGKALTLNNFEPWFNGGYRRIDGFERFDGRPKPSEQTFTGFDVSDASSLTLGDTVTDDVTGATGTCIGIYIDDGTWGSDSIGVTKITVAEFGLNNTCNTSAFTIDRVPVLRYAVDNDTELTWLLEAQDLYRVDIEVCPGAGPTLGAWQRDASAYAVRDNIGATAGILHVASAAGWVTTGIVMTEYIFFDAGGAGAAQALPAVGDTITGLTSSATGTVHKVIRLGGTTATNDAFGYLVLTGVTGGPFTDDEKLQESATSFADADGVEATFSFPIEGDYRFLNHNYYGGSGTYRTYGVSAVGPAFEIDENNVVTPILFPLVDDGTQPDFNTPFLVEEHRNYLFLAYPGGRFAHSVAGEPLVFDGFLGAAEFGVGDEITGLNSVVGGVLAITTERESRGLFGKDISDWEMKLLAEKTGGKLHSTQKLDTVYALDDLGITSMARTDKFGDFVGATVSQLIQPLVSALRKFVTDSTIVRSSNQYRVYFSDNTGIIMYVPNTGMDENRQASSRMLVQFGFMVYPIPVRRIYNTDDDAGIERTYFCSDSGYIYEDQIGNNFDGAEIPSACRLVFNQVGSPSYRKRFRRAVMELESQKPLLIKVISDLTYGSSDSSSGNVDVDVEAGGGLWDVDNWDEFFFDGQTVSTAQAGLTGTGSNIGLLMYNSTAKVRPFILQGMTLHYEHRRLQR